MHDVNIRVEVSNNAVCLKGYGFVSQSEELLS